MVKPSETIGGGDGIGVEEWVVETESGGEENMLEIGDAGAIRKRHCNPAVLDRGVNGFHRCSKFDIGKIVERVESGIGPTDTEI